MGAHGMRRKEPCHGQRRDHSDQDEHDETGRDVDSHIDGSRQIQPSAETGRGITQRHFPARRARKGNHRAGIRQHSERVSRKELNHHDRSKQRNCGDGDGQEATDIAPGKND